MEERVIVDVDAGTELILSKKGSYIRGLIRDGKFYSAGIALEKAKEEGEISTGEFIELSEDLKKIPQPKKKKGFLPPSFGKKVSNPYLPTGRW